MEKGNETVNQLKLNCQTKPSTGYFFFFYDKVVLHLINYMAKLVAKMLTVEMPDMTENIKRP